MCLLHVCVSDRFILKQVEGSGIVKYFIQTFTRCFLRELALLPQQVGPSFQIKHPKFIHHLVKAQVDVEFQGIADVGEIKHLQI